MPRLFLAIDLPDDLAKSLTRNVPQPGDGIRPIPPEQLHLTLHFLGDANVDAVRSAVGPIIAPMFRLQLSGVGSFGSRRRGTIIWAGFDECLALLELHSALSSALQRTGGTAETRPYCPHLTLARCRPGTSPAAIAEFQRRHAAQQLPAFDVQEFSLYSSELTSAGPVYRREAVFPLR